MRPLPGGGARGSGPPEDDEPAEDGLDLPEVRRALRELGGALGETAVALDRALDETLDRWTVAAADAEAAGPTGPPDDDAHRPAAPTGEGHAEPTAEGPAGPTGEGHADPTADDHPIPGDAASEDGRPGGGDDADDRP